MTTAWGASGLSEWAHCRVYCHDDNATVMHLTTHTTAVSHGTDDLPCHHRKYKDEPMHQTAALCRVLYQRLEDHGAHELRRVVEHLVHKRLDERGKERLHQRTHHTRVRAARLSCATQRENIRGCNTTRSATHTRVQYHWCNSTGASSVAISCVFFERNTCTPIAVQHNSSTTTNKVPSPRIPTYSRAFPRIHTVPYRFHTPSCIPRSHIKRCPHMRVAVYLQTPLLLKARSNLLRVVPGTKLPHIAVFQGALIPQRDHGGHPRERDLRITRGISSRQECHQSIYQEICGRRREGGCIAWH